MLYLAPQQAQDFHDRVRDDLLAGDRREALLAGITMLRERLVGRYLDFRAAGFEDDMYARAVDALDEAGMDVAAHLIAWEGGGSERAWRSRGEEEIRGRLVAALQVGDVEAVKRQEVHTRQALGSARDLLVATEELLDRLDRALDPDLESRELDPADPSWDTVSASEQPGDGWDEPQDHDDDDDGFWRLDGPPPRRAPRARLRAWIGPISDRRSDVVARSAVCG